MLPAGADPRDSEIRPLWEGPLRLERPPEPECPAERSEHKWGQTSAYNSPHDGGRKCQLCGLEERTIGRIDSDSGARVKPPPMRSSNLALNTRV